MIQFFLETNNTHEIRSKTVHLVFISKFICNYSFVIFINCNHQQIKSIFYN